jgi:uncharacterized membrane-anchored protein
MRAFAGLCLAAMMAAAPASADQGPYPETEDELRAAFAALHWQSKPGSYQLPASHATVQLPAGQTLLLGADAERYSWLTSGVEFPGTEAVLTYDSDGANSEVYYDWRDEGYVSDSDWEEVDGDALLAQYRDATEASNEERAANGMKPMHVVGWLEPPRYDQATRTVTYALELKDDESHWTNAVALRLGRAGYTEFTWVGSIDLFKGASGRPDLLNQALAAHSFDQGYRYEDFKEGDKVAAYGVAGLVATALGVKFGKGIIAAVIAFLVAGKKILIPAAAVAVVALARFGRRLFNRGS